MNQETQTLAEATQAFVERYADEARSVARVEHANSWLMGADDVEQAIWMYVLDTQGIAWFLQHEVNLANAYVEDGLTNEQITERVRRKIRGLFHRAAAQYCRMQRQDYEVFTGAVLYSGDMVAALLEDAVFASTEDIDGKFDLITGRVDILTKLNVMPSKVSRRAVYKKYALGEVLTPTERKALQRGIEWLTSALNGDAANESRQQVRLEDIEEKVEAHD